VISWLGCCAGAGSPHFPSGSARLAYWFPKARQGRRWAPTPGSGTSPRNFTLLLPFALVTVGLPGVTCIGLVFLAGGPSCTRHRPERLVLPVIARERRWGRRAESAVHGQELFPSGTSWTAFFSLRELENMALVAIYFTTFGGFIAMNRLASRLLDILLFVTPILAGMLAGVFSIVTSPRPVGGGYISDRIGGRPQGSWHWASWRQGDPDDPFGDFSLSVSAEILMAIGMGWPTRRLQTGCQEIPRRWRRRRVGGRTRAFGGSPSRRSWGSSCRCRGPKATRTDSCLHLSGGALPSSHRILKRNAPWFRRPRFKGFALHGFLRL